MEETVSLQIPYRLETPEAIMEAMRINLLDIGNGYNLMLALAKKVTIHLPPALLHARKSVQKDFISLKEEKMRESHVRYHEIAGLDLINHFQPIERAIPRANCLIEYDNIFSFVGSLSQNVQKLCGMENLPSAPLKMFESALTLRKFIRNEMLIYLAAKKTKHISMEELRLLLIALTLYDPRNEDVLNALKSSKLDAHSILYQNALAELLFSRLPKSIEGLLRINTKAIRQKLFSKVAKLNLTSKQKVMLYGYFQPYIAKEALIAVLHEVDAIAQRISLAQEVKAKLHEYILSLINKIVHGQQIYRKLFLNKEIAIMQKLYTPRNVMEHKVTYKEAMVKTHTHIATLQFYPTKDYLDLFKGTASDDCIGVSLGEQHLLTPNFFNIRIFRDSKWIGNIYMLDFTEENGALLVDRIQMPRGTNAYYIHFFRDLKNIFEEIFVDVDYKKILLPLTISNHAAVQKVFNRHKEKLSRKTLHVNISQAAHFNSLSPNQIYYILCEKI